MKKRNVLMTLAMLLITLAAKAGEGDTYLSLNAGVLHPKVFTINAAYQKEISYGNAYEFYIDYQTQWTTCPDCGEVCSDSFWKNRYSYSAGLAYKKAIHRGKNTITRVRAGADLGSYNNRKFAASLEVGIEYALTVRGGVQVVFSQKNEIMFFGKPTWKSGLLAGIRVPL